MLEIFSDVFLSLLVYIMHDDTPELVWDVSQAVNPVPPFALMLLNHSVTESNADRIRELWCKGKVINILQVPFLGGLT